MANKQVLNFKILQILVKFRIYFFPKGTEFDSKVKTFKCPNAKSWQLKIIILKIFLKFPVWGISKNEELGSEVKDSKFWNPRYRWHEA